MPLGAILAATAQGRGDVNSAHLHPYRRSDPVSRRLAYVESAIAVKNGRIAAIELDTFFVRDKDGHLGTVFTRHKSPSGLEFVRFECRLRSLEKRRLARFYVVMIDLARRGQAGEIEKSLVLIKAPAKAARRTDARQFHRTNKFAIGGMLAYLSRRILQILCEKMSTHSAGTGQGFLTLGNNGFPICACRFGEVDRDYAALRRIQIRLHPQCVTAGTDGCVLGVEFKRDWGWRYIGC